MKHVQETMIRRNGVSSVIGFWKADALKSISQSKWWLSGNNLLIHLLRERVEF